MKNIKIGEVNPGAPTAEVQKFWKENGGSEVGGNPQ